MYSVNLQVFVALEESSSYKHNYKQLIRYLNDDEYSSLMKVIYLSAPDCYPIHLKVSLKEYFYFDLYVSKEEFLFNIQFFFQCFY